MKHSLTIKQILTIMLFCCLSSFLIISCKKEKTPSNKQYQQNTDTTSRTYLLHKALDKFIDNAKQLDKANFYDEPIPAAFVKIGQFLFNPFYGSTVNPGIEIVDFSLSWNQLSNLLKINQYKDSSSNNYRLAFYYLINNKDTNNKYYTYVISIAKTDTEEGDTLEPISTAADNTYLMLSKNAVGYELINAADFQKYASEYYLTTKYYSLQTGMNLPVREYYHPLISHHSINSFHTFYMHNRDSVMTGEELKLKIINIVENPDNDIVNRTSGNSYDDFCQVPLCFFHVQNRVFLSNADVVNKYTYRGFNVGRLCPPQCN